MALPNIVRLSQLEGATRLDAQLYQSKYVNIKAQLTKINHVSIGELADRCKKGIFDIKAEKYVSEGVPFIRVSNLKNGLIDSTDLTFIPFEIHKKEIETEFHKYDILLSKTAYPAASSVFFDKCNISQDIIGISLKNLWRKKLYGPYIVAFLNSRYGLAQMQQWFQGNIQTHLALLDVKRMIIPILPDNLQQKISDLYSKAQTLIQNSKDLYIQAETLLLEELGIKDFKPQYKEIYTANLSDAVASHRIDAGYFQPVYEEFVRKIKSYQNGFDKLLKYIEHVTPNFDPTKYPDQVFSYIELADIDSSIGIIYSDNKVKGDGAPSRARRMLKENDVIVSSVEGSLEKVAIVNKEYDGSLASTGFFQFRPLNILPEVLLVISRTIVLQLQLKKQCSGTILTAVPKESLREFIIPKLSPGTQHEIAYMVQQSHDARKKANRLLEITKKTVEIAIENNEKKALNYIHNETELFSV